MGHQTSRRDLIRTRLPSWNDLLVRLNSVQLTQGHDDFRWTLCQNGKFTVESMYRALSQLEVPIDENNKKIWKMKMALKLKVFTWYLRRGVILTKDNLVKRNWHGNTKCVFCPLDETIKHLFFECSFARSIWSSIQIASNLYPPTSVANIFGHWLHGIDNKLRPIIRVGAIAITWSLWLSRNDKVFNDKDSTRLHVIYRCTSILRSWSILQRVEHRDLFTEACARLEAVARDIFIRHGWSLDRRIGPP